MVPIFVFYNFAFKVCNTGWIMPSFCDFITIFPQWFKNEIFNEVGGWSFYVLVNIYMCLNVKPLKESTYFSYKTLLN